MAEFSSPVLELLARSADCFEGRTAVFAGAISDPSILHLAKLCREAVVLCDDYTAACGMAALLGQELPQRLNASVTLHHITVIYTAPQLFVPPQCDLFCLLLHKTKPVNQYLLASVTRALIPDGSILAAGANDAGGRSADSYLKSHGILYKRDSARKCTLWQVHFNKHMPFAYPPLSLVLSDEQIARCNAELQEIYAGRDRDAAGRTYLSLEPEPGTRMPQLELNLHGHTLKLFQDVNVFSPGRLDEGTAQLISCLPDFVRSPALDLCCGCGVVGLSLCAMGINTAFCDLSAAALFLTELNLSACDLRSRSLGVRASNMLSDLNAGAGYGLIAVNPPFHQGVSRQSAPVRGLFAEVKNYLQPGGCLLCVGNAFLGYDRQLPLYLPEVRVAARSTRFVTTAASADPLPPPAAG